MRKISFIAFLSLIFVSCFASGKKDGDFTIRYLFGDRYKKQFEIYENDSVFSELSNLDGRDILEIRFDRENTDRLLFAEKQENHYSVRSFNYVSCTEKVLFEFEQEIHRFRAFTEDSFFWCERCEKNREPHVLYEYNSKTGEVKKLYEVEDVLRANDSICYENRYRCYVSADDENVFFYVDGGFAGGSGNYILNRKTGAVRKNEMNIGWSSQSRFGNKIVREGSSVASGDGVMSWSTDGKSCVITDLDTLKETTCTFKKRYQRQGGKIVLLSDNYLLVPFESQPFRDSIRNGLFGSTWTVRYTVFDIEKNKAVFDGLEKRGGNYFVDAVLMASPL